MSQIPCETGPHSRLLRPGMLVAMDTVSQAPNYSLRAAGTSPEA